MDASARAALISVTHWVAHTGNVISGDEKSEVKDSEVLVLLGL